MSEQEQAVPLVEKRIETVQAASINDVLKNALDWKQWMADDLRLLIKTKKTEGLSESSIKALISHHIKTYNLLNVSFGMVTGNPDDKLFDLPELELLQQAIPTLGAGHTEQEPDTDIEPMLELTIDSLSKDLRTETESTPEPIGQPEDQEIEPIEQDTQEAEPELAPAEPIEQELEPEQPIGESQAIEPETAQESVASEDDSKVISTDLDAPTLTNDLKTTDDIPVETPVAVNLPEEPVSVMVIAANQEIAQPAIVESLLAIGEANEITTEDLMSKIWNNAMSSIGNDIIENGVSDSYAHINESVNTTGQIA